MRHAAVIHWLLPGQYPDPKQLLTSNLASIRLRAGFAYAALYASGYEVTFGDTITKPPQVIIIGKIGASSLNKRSEHWLKQIRFFVQQYQSAIALDYTDNHLDSKSVMSDFYCQALRLADYYVVPSTYLASSLNLRKSRRTFLVDDGLEFVCSPPRFTALDAPNRALWFGHESNLEYLLEFLKTTSTSTPYELAIVSGAQAPAILKSTNLNLAQFANKITFIPWSIENLIATAKECNICIIPSNPRDVRKAGASPNRLITSLALGLPTAADRLESYSKFEKFFVDLRAPQFEELLENPHNFHSMVRNAQDDVVPYFFPENIGKQWINCIQSMIRRN